MLAAELIESIKPNEFGWYFPSTKDPSKPVSHGTLYSFLWRQRDRGVISYATNRDLRRTLKTLAGKAGVSKENDEEERRERTGSEPLFQSIAEQLNAAGIK